MTIIDLNEYRLQKEERRVEELMDEFANLVDISPFEDYEAESIDELMEIFTEGVD